MENQQSQIIKELLEICRQAGERIMEIYETADFEAITDFKADNSPLTLADKESHKVIDAGLHSLPVEYPVLSEEGKGVEFAERSSWGKFWLVDPLDGTKEFIKRNGEFTINIALIEEGFPVLGVIYAPAQDLFYYAAEGEAYKLATGAEPELLKLQLKPKAEVAVGSRSHSAPEEVAFLEELGITEVKSMGSAFKFALIAEGLADIYYRHNPTMEWDTGAGQALVEAAGGKVVGLDGERFSYNKKVLVNPSFKCWGNIQS